MTTPPHAARIRVCQIWTYYPPLQAGGALRYNQLNPWLKKLGVDVEVLTLRWKGLAAEETINETLIRRVSPGPFKQRNIWAFLSSFTIFWQLFTHRQAYDLIHAVTNNPFYLPIYWFARLIGKPVLIDFTVIQSENVSFLGNLLTRLGYLGFRSMDAYIGNSSALIEQLQAYGLPPDKCHLIYNGVFTSLFTPLEPQAREAQRSAMGLAPEVNYLLFVGAFISRKGIDILLDTLIALRQVRSDVQLVVIGKHVFPDQPDAQAFSEQQKQRIQEHHLDGQVQLLGPVAHSEYLRWLQVCDLFVFPSRREGMPRVILEAMSVGLPCVCSAMEGITNEMIENQVSGVIIEDNNPAGFAAAIQQLLDDRARHSQMGQMARSQVMARFSDEKAIEVFKQLYLRLLDRHS